MQDPQFVQQTFKQVAARYIFTNHVLSCGLDIVWRKKAIQQLQQQVISTNAKVLDIATGTGDLALSIQEHFPQWQITAIDFSQEMLAIAKKRGLKNCELEDAMNLTFPANSFDVVTVAFGLRNMADYQKALLEMQRVLRPGGVLLILDFNYPQGFLKLFSAMYLRYFMPIIGGLITGSKQCYQYLWQSIKTFPAGEKMQHLLGEVNYQNITCQPLIGGVSSLYLAQAPTEKVMK